MSGASRLVVPELLLRDGERLVICADGSWIVELHTQGSGQFATPTVTPKGHGSCGFTEALFWLQTR